MLKRLRTAVESLRDDRGSSLPEVMVSVIVSAITMSVIAGAVVAVGSLNKEMVLTGVAASESSYTDLRWSNDVRAAVSITPTDSTSVAFTVPGKAGKCSVSEWGPGAGGVGLTVTTTAYPTLSGVTCSGAPSIPTSEEIVASSTNLAFTYKNPGGRELNFVAGVPVLTNANQPSNVAYDAWQSKSVGTATLQTTAAANTGWQRPIISTRTASTILSAGAGLANAGTTLVAGGNLIAANYLVSSVAGTSVSGWADGAAAAAKFTNPSGLTVDIDGNVFVADTANNRIRKITASGTVTTVAGSGVAGFLNDVGPAAMFNAPSDVTVDVAGNLFVADTGNQLIRKIAADGVVTTFAGAPGLAGTVNGSGAAARFNGPSAIAVDSSGNLYVAELTGHTIRKVSSGGAATTLAGAGVAGFADGTGAAARFNAPEGVDVDAAGNVYVADTVNNRVRKVSAAGAVTTIGGAATSGFVDGTAVNSRFSAPRGVSVDVAGNVFVADTANQRIRQITSAANVITVAGKTTAGSADATGAASTFSNPYDVDVAPGTSGRVLIADRGNNKIRGLQ